MWTSMPSGSIHSVEDFFTLEDLESFSQELKSNPPIVRGRVWGGEERSQTWAIECRSFEDFKKAIFALESTVEFFAYDELCLDDDTMHLVQDELTRYVHEEELSHDLIMKAISALRGHENEMFAVVAYAFLKSGRVLFARSQNELARYIDDPSRLLSTDGLTNVRKLKTLNRQL